MRLGARQQPIPAGGTWDPLRKAAFRFRDVLRSEVRPPFLVAFLATVACAVVVRVTHLAFPWWGRAGATSSIEWVLAACLPLYWAGLLWVLYGCVHESMDALAQADSKSWRLLMALFVAMGLLPALVSLFLLLR
jgi:hypothetical protein